MGYVGAGETERERGYIEGRRFSLVQQLTRALVELKAFSNIEDDPLIKLAVFVKEREETVSRLREICEEHGDNDWDDKSYLPDVIEKNLGRHLDNKF